MTRRRRAAFRALLCAGVLLCGWWLLYVPGRADALYRAIPAGANALGKHGDVPPRWQEVVRNPLALSLFSSAGVGAEKLAGLPQDLSVKRLVHRLIPGDVVWAHVPELGPDREPAWVFASWLGGRSQVLRWVLTLAPPASFDRRRLPSGGVYWVVETDQLSEDRSLQVAFLEGVLVGCVSARDDGVSYIAETLWGRRPSLVTTAADIGTRTGCDDQGAQDFGWMRLDARGTAGWPPSLIGCEFDELSATVLSGRLCIPGRLVDGVAVRAETGDSLPLPLPRPIAIGTISPDSAPSLVRGFDPVWRELVGRLRDEAAGTIMLVVLGDDYSGRYMGMKVPTVLVVVPVQDAERANSVMRTILDRVNARYQLGLIPRRVPAGNRKVMALEKIVDTHQHRLTLRERPAYVVRDKLLLVASSLDGLVRVVDEADARGEETRPSGESWRYVLGESGALVCGWFDLPRSAKNLRTIFKFYAGKLRATDAAKAQQVGPRFDALGGWLTALEPMEVCRLRLDGDDAGTKITFSLGEE